MDNLGQKIKDFRKLKGMSMPVFSSIVGIPKDRIYKWEKGAVPYETNDRQRLLDTWIANQLLFITTSQIRHCMII